MTVTRASFRGSRVELRQDDNNQKAKPRPLPIGELTPNDRVSTVAHLASTIHENAKHALVHAKEAAAQAEKVSGDIPNSATIQHNANHAFSHVQGMAEHAVKLQKHLEKYPGVAAAVEDLKQAAPLHEPKPLKGKKR